MKKQNIKDIHSLADYLLSKYSDGGKFSINNALEEGVRIAKEKNLTLEILEYGIEKAVEYALHRERKRKTKEEEPMYVPGITQKGETSKSIGREEFLENNWNRPYNSHLLYLRHTYKGVTKPMGEFTKLETLDWAAMRRKAYAVGDRRAAAWEKLAKSLKNNEDKLKTAQRNKLALLEAEYGGIK